MAPLTPTGARGDRSPRLVEAARYAVCDDSDGGGEVLAPSIDEVIGLAESLDGHAFDQLVVLVEIEGHHVQVGVEGDAEGLMALTISDDSTIHRLVDPNIASGQEASLQSGGVRVPVPRRQLVSADDALRRFRTFLSSGEFDGSGSWDREPSIISPTDDVDAE